ncbi:MAG TPA: GNAT family N-acetyltransferase [Cyanobacteria bacterium UBA8530]|nr:GNAT family N-acetyltransferase [Cyanobacteria bacterium UBA8530]
MYLKSKVVVRSFRPEDAESLAKQANNRKIWLNLRDLFPYPYRLEDARRFIARTASQVPEENFAIEVEKKAVGAIALIQGKDVERCSAEIGFWLGEEYWGRGIATSAVESVRDWAVETRSLIRLFAFVFGHNTASRRVLEKAGFELEGRLRCSAVKDGRITDQLLLAYLSPRMGKI